MRTREKGVVQGTVISARSPAVTVTVFSALGWSPLYLATATKLLWFNVTRIATDANHNVLLIVRPATSLNFQRPRPRSRTE